MFKKLLSIPAARRRLPGRPTPIPHRRAALRQRPPAQGPVSGRSGDRDLRPGLLLGRRAQVLAARRRRLRHRGRLRRRPHAEPDLRGGLLGPHRPQRGGAGGLRSGSISLRAAAQDVLGEPRPDPGHAAGQRRRHAVPLRHLHVTTPAAAHGGRGVRRPTYGAALDDGGLRRDHDRDPRRAGPFYFAEDYHQQYLAKNPTATAASAAPACPARSASARRSPRTDGIDMHLRKGRILRPFFMRSTCCG